jgi:hypothetical protein
VKLDLARLVGPLFAALALVLIVQQTLGALHASGIWSHRRSPRVVATSPFTPIDGLLGRGDDPRSAALRDPFAYGRTNEPAPARKPAAPRPPRAPAAPPPPVLTSIVWVEGNPSATVRWNGHDYPVQTNTLFDEFRVQSITRNQVILVHGGEILVLQLPKKGD